MTPEQKIKWAIVAKTYGWQKKEPPVFPCENIDEIYDHLVENDEHWDGKNETRCGDHETNIPSEYSRHYESKSVSMQFPDGSWVGWTYWYGGGKHSEPEAIDWMEDAYDLNCVEQEKVITERVFSKPVESA